MVGRKEPTIDATNRVDLQRRLTAAQFLGCQRSLQQRFVFKLHVRPLSNPLERP
jgi:hypothetical protein